jgi:hypothetical protein
MYKKILGNQNATVQRISGKCMDSGRDSYLLLAWGKQKLFWFISLNIFGNLPT